MDEDARNLFTGNFLTIEQEQFAALELLTGGLGGITGRLSGGVQPVILDLFGGSRTQVQGAINVDIISKDGISAYATRLPLKSSSVDEVIASNPFIPDGNGILDFLPEAARVARQNGDIIINSTIGNKFGGNRLPNQDILNDLGLEVIQVNGPLLPRFREQTFRLTDKTPIPERKVLSTVLRKQ